MLLSLKSSPQTSIKPESKFTNLKKKLPKITSVWVLIGMSETYFTIENKIYLAAERSDKGKMFESFLQSLPKKFFNFISRVQIYKEWYTGCIGKSPENALSSEFAGFFAKSVHFHRHLAIKVIKKSLENVIKLSLQINWKIDKTNLLKFPFDRKEEKQTSNVSMFSQTSSCDKICRQKKNSPSNAEQKMANRI